VKVIQAYRFALDLSSSQERGVLAQAGAARVAHNWALAHVKAVMDQRAAERTYGVPDGLLTPALSWSLAGLRKAWNTARADVAPWWSEVSKEAFNTGLDALARALKNWADSRSRKTGPDRRTARRPSKRWERASARLGRAHARVANLRRDGLHKLTTRLTAEHATVVVEDLNVTGMLANRRLARHIADAGFAEIRRQLTYKAGWNGGRLLVADRWYPSSKTCSGCGAVKAKLALSERDYECEACGLVIDRDRNAALNLATLAAECNTAGSGPVAGRGADRKTRARGQVAVKRQPGTASADQTGTVPPQGRTTDRVLTKAH
jgi:IS605 OrfB family transposase